MQLSAIIAFGAYALSQAAAAPNNVLRDDALEECTPGAYICQNLSPPEIWVCNGSGFWQLSSRCGGAGCCRYQSNGQPYCFC